jgi:hypothetical protein
MGGVRWTSRIAAMVAVLSCTAPVGAVFAKPAKAVKAPEPGIAVVAHVALQGGAADQLFAREGPKNQILLYVVQDAGRSISVVDITAPARASLVKRLDTEPQALGGHVVTIGTNTLAVESDIPRVPDAPPAVRTVRFFDLSDPATPRVALQFERVSTYILDASRSLIYLVNSEGLWIIRHVEPMDWRTKAWMDFASTP